MNATDRPEPMTARFEWRNSLCTPDFPAAAYEALRLRVAEHTPFNTLAWMCASEQALAVGCQVHVLLAWRGDELQLCLPLVASVERFGGLPFRVLHHLGYPWPIAWRCLPAWTPGTCARHWRRFAANCPTPCCN